MAAVLSAPFPPFRRASNLIHEDPDVYNSIAAQSFVSIHFFGASSIEPLV